MREKRFRGIRPDDPHGRMGLRNPERGFRTEIYFSTIPGEIAGTCSCHSKQNKLDGRSLKPSCQNETLTGCPRLIRGNRLDAVEFSHAQWQDELDYFTYDGVTVMQSYCFLMKYSDGRPLPPEKLEDIEVFFRKLRESGAKALLRFAYELYPTFTGPAAETILNHIAQLRPLLRRYQDVIYVLQCGFVGRFGEFHHSFHHLEEDPGFRRELLSAVLEALPEGKKTMLRYPRLKRELFGNAPLTEAEAFSNTAPARIGHFNDFFMGNNNHGGTFGAEELTLEEEFRNHEEESRFLPMDGELQWRDLAGVALPHEALFNFFRWHYDTFSMVHGHSLFEQEFYPVDWWKSVPVDPMFLHDNRIPFSNDYFSDAAGNFVPRSHFEYIRDHLGYRLELQSAALPESVRAGGRLEVEIHLVNRGFSAPVTPRPVNLVLQCGSERRSFPFETDVRRWYGGTEQELTLSVALPPEMAPGIYQAGFALPDASEIPADNPEFAIRCANFLEYRDGVNQLGMEITLQP